MPFYIVLNPHGIGDVRKEGTYIGKKVIFIMAIIR